jgi:hypothetical protein
MVTPVVEVNKDVGSKSDNRWNTILFNEQQTRADKGVHFYS